MVKKDEKEPLQTAESTLSPQFGSDTVDLVHGIYDVRRLTKLNPLEKAWISYFLLLPTMEGGDFARAFCSGYMNLAMSEEGWNKNKMIQMTAASKGAPGIGELFKKPGWFARNLTRRDWQKKADEEGKTVVE